MFKNVASQKIQVFAFDTTTGVGKTGDAANITVYVSKDNGSVTALTDTSATEMDATNAKGVYVFDVAQAETNADYLVFTGKSSTSNIVIVPQFIYTTPPKFSTLVIDLAGLVDANAVKVGPSGSGTAQTAGDIVANENTIAGYIDTEVAAIKAKTDNLPASFPSNFSSLSITAAGLVAVSSNVKKNQALSGFTFVMTDSTTHAPKTGVTVTAQRSLNGAAFGSCTNAPTEISNGLYTIDLSAADLNANTVDLRFTGTSSDDLNILILTQP